LVSHVTAARLWGLDGVETEEVHVTVLPYRSVRAEGIVVHHSGERLPADVSSPGPPRATSPLRTAIDLASVLGAEDLELAIESGLRRRLFSVGQLRWRADALLGAGRPGSSRLRTILNRRDLGRTESRWEVRTAQLLEQAGFERPVRQYEVRAGGRVVARPDLAYPDARLALEYDSDRWHSGVARRHADADRRNRLRAVGWTVIEVTPAALGNPDELVAPVLAA
jgi:hypothetical protein